MKGNCLFNWSNIGNLILCAAKVHKLGQYSRAASLGLYFMQEITCSGASCKLKWAPLYWPKSVDHLEYYSVFTCWRKKNNCLIQVRIFPQILGWSSPLFSSCVRSRFLRFLCRTQSLLFALLYPLMPNCTYVLFLILRYNCCKKLILTLFTHKSPKHTIEGIEINHSLYIN